MVGVWGLWVEGGRERGACHRVLGRVVGVGMRVGLRKVVGKRGYSVGVMMGMGLLRRVGWVAVVGVEGWVGGVGMGMVWLGVGVGVVVSGRMVMDSRLCLVELVEGLVAVRVALYCLERLKTQLGKTVNFKNDQNLDNFVNFLHRCPNILFCVIEVGTETETPFPTSCLIRRHLNEAIVRQSSLFHSFLLMYLV